jgi:hypothetical protein
LEVLDRVQEVDVSEGGSVHAPGCSAPYYDDSAGTRTQLRTWEVALRRTGACCRADLLSALPELAVLAPVLVALVSGYELGVTDPRRVDAARLALDSCDLDPSWCSWARSALDVLDTRTLAWLRGTGQEALELLSASVRSGGDVYADSVLSAHGSVSSWHALARPLSAAELRAADLTSSAVVGAQDVREQVLAEVERTSGPPEPEVLVVTSSRRPRMGALALAALRVNEVESSRRGPGLVLVVPRSLADLRVMLHAEVVALEGGDDAAVLETAAVLSASVPADEALLSARALEE